MSIFSSPQNIVARINPWPQGFPGSVADLLGVLIKPSMPIIIYGTVNDLNSQLVAFFVKDECFCTKWYIWQVGIKS